MAANTTNTTKKFNPTITAMFRNEKFGTDALLSANIDAKGFAVVQQQLQIGSKLLIRKSAKPSKNGGETYFLEILPPYEGAANTNTRRTSTDNSGI